MRTPNVWPDAGLFAFSGLDGPTDWARPFVGVTSGQSVAFDFRTTDAGGRPAPFVRLDLGLPTYPGPVEGAAVLGDALHIPATKDAPEARVAWIDRATLAGELSRGTPRLLPLSGPVSVGKAADGVTCASMQEVARAALAVAPRGGGSRFCLAFDHCGGEPRVATAARERAVECLGRSVAEVYKARTLYQRGLGLPDGLDARTERLYRKCASVLKLNVEGPQGAMGSRWTTPDRWPHRHMWLWDSAFHAIGLVEFDRLAAQEAVLAPLSRAGEGGFIPHMMTPDPRLDSGITQPPILGWAAWKVFGATGDEAFLAEAEAGASACLGWILRHRRSGELLKWLAEDDPNCRCGECGMDNSPRFDPPGVAGAVDLSAYAVLEAEALSRAAAALGREEESRRWGAEAKRIASAVEYSLWDESRGVYRDLSPGGGFTPHESVAGFLPLTAGIPTAERAARLVETLKTPGRFWRPLPVPSVSADGPAYGDDMWRGPAWVNMNYLVIEGLRRYGFDGEASELATRTLDAVLASYEREGVTFEFYDAEGKRWPSELNRKGRSGRGDGEGFAVIRDYNWTAALALRLLAEGERPSAAR